MKWQDLILKIAWKFPPYFFVIPFIFWFRKWPKVEGIENLRSIPPDEGVLITPLHPHHMDELPLGEILRELFQSMREKRIFWFVDHQVDRISQKKKYKFLSLIFKYVYMEFNTKSSRVTLVLDRLVDVIKKGGNVVLFPEGKMGKDKKDRKFWGASYIAYQSNNCLILPTWIGYDLPFRQIKGTLFQMIREGAKDFLSLRKHMTISFGKLYRLSDYISLNAEEIQKEDLIKITKEVILPQIYALNPLST